MREREAGQPALDWGAFSNLLEPSATFWKFLEALESVAGGGTAKALVAALGRSRSTSAPSSTYCTSQPASPASPAIVTDRTMIGNLDVPHLGLGTIAWSPDTPADEERFGSIARAAMDSGLDFFDTAERYGAKPLSLIPAALASLLKPSGKGWGRGEQVYLGGDTETRLASWAAGGTVATKIAPTPWRGDAQSIVDACRASAARLSVDRVALMQVHMPDIIQPFAAFGYENRREEASPRPYPLHTS
ncbi:hypothetical protein T484DRAFT_1783936 [Baffinella frigidus]|nr:hypothetical protein T484DRAFT_1783936 [Cryptophyta sp. CCMP2293]